jgi:hypothetical protein
MLHLYPKTYFYGEFGCLNYSILGHLEERQPTILVATQPDYFKLLRMKCHKIGNDEDYQIYRANCKGAGFGLTINSPVIEELHSKGYVSLHKYLGFKKDRCIHYIKPIKTPFRFDIGLKQKYISVSFRNRAHEPERNLSDMGWERVLEVIRGYNLPIVAHGMSIDTKEFDGIIKAETIEESVAYLNKSQVFIASMSGIAQFASNCACGIIQIGDPSRHIDYDPFNKGAVAVWPKDFKNALRDFL